MRVAHTPALFGTSVHHTFKQDGRKICTSRVQWQLFVKELVAVKVDHAAPPFCLLMTHRAQNLEFLCHFLGEQSLSTSINCVLFSLAYLVMGFQVRAA